MAILPPLARRQQGLLSRGRSFVRFGKLRHRVEGIAGGHLRGWVFRPGEPRRRFEVVAETAGHTTFGLADLYRADVHRAGLGSQGYCGFSIPVAEHAAAPTRVMIVDAGRLRHLATLHPEDRAPQRFAVLGDLCFALDPGETRLTGWLSSTRNPDDRRRMSLHVDGETVSSRVACLYRRCSPPDAVDGFHGFSIAIPAAGRRVDLLDDASGQRLHTLRR